MIDGIIIAAPSSGSGKTLITLGILRALRRREIAACGGKVGPDYIDPSFHRSAAGRDAHNLDVWAMRRGMLTMRLESLGGENSLMVTEGVMGLYDGIGHQGVGSTAEFAEAVNWPVVMVIDARGAAASVAAVLQGFANFQEPDRKRNIRVVGVIANRVGSANHADVIEKACRRAMPDVAWLGSVKRDERLVLPARHLGLVQAMEHPELEEFIDEAADIIEQSINLDLLLKLAKPANTDLELSQVPAIPPLGQRIAVAQDAAFGFAYNFVLSGWRAAGAELLPFSPMANEGPDRSADAIYLCGGYPELHIGRIAHASHFRNEMLSAAKRGATIYGECGGYMVLGDALIDVGGVAHQMLGMLPVVTSFAERRLQLGYRRVQAIRNSFLGMKDSFFRGHEFHYAGIVNEEESTALF
ncbi:MAG: cobyrinate a,c-diamide synthase, partial [Alphaproteobacteria bacterium]|nr:cobyrinate a,c-diamide synthase [Alphaproteobacteria bacterium]